MVLGDSCLPPPLLNYPIITPVPNCRDLVVCFHIGRKLESRQHCADYDLYIGMFARYTAFLCR